MNVATATMLNSRRDSWYTNVKILFFGLIVDSVPSTANQGDEVTRERNAHDIQAGECGTVPLEATSGIHTTGRGSGWGTIQERNTGRSEGGEHSSSSLINQS